MVVLTALGILSCSTGPSFQRFVFSADSTIQCREIEIGGLSLRVPADWTAAPGVEASAGMEASSKAFAEQTHLALLDTITGATVRVGLFDRRLLAARDFPEWATQEVQRECDANPGMGISEKWLRLQDVRVVQLMLSDSAAMRFRIFAEGDVPVLLEYTVPQRTVQQTMRYVETTLSSLRREGATAAS